MHPNAAFAWTDRAAMLEFLDTRAFSTIIISGPDKVAIAHAPVLVRGGDQIWFHLSRSNQAVSHATGAHAILSCTGFDCYVSPDWYGSADQVPTWNYLAVECEGPLRSLSEGDLVELLDGLSERHERPLAPKPAWTRAKMSPGRFAAMTRAIQGFALTIESIAGTRKLGQNKTADERSRVAEELAAAGRSDVAALMRPDER